MIMPQALRKLLTGKASSTWVEFLRFLPVGGVTTVIDFGVLIILTEHFGLHYLISAAISFLAGQVWSYLLCTSWIFAKVKIRSHVSGFSAFLAIAVIGLGITELFLWYFTEELGLYYLYSKIIASFVSFLVLFFVRKRLLFS